MTTSYSDEMSFNGSKHLLSVDPYGYSGTLWQQFGNASYGVVEEKKDDILPSPDFGFISNNNIWEQIIYNPIQRTDRIYRLDSFFLFEWFPRSPGLFFTDMAWSARNEAKNRIRTTKDGITVYDPLGKLSMLEGGIGNVRLRPITIKGEDYYFMSASSNGNCHEGFPVALTEDLRNEVIDEIKERGTVVKDLIGRLKSIPAEIDNAYQGYRKVPKKYLLIEELRDPSHPKSRKMEGLSVTVATTFISSYEHTPKLYASFVGFDPSNQQEFEGNIKWMEEEYVKEMYKGQVLTDFDQTTNHFLNVPFSLQKIMNQEVDEADFAGLINLTGGDYNAFLLFQRKIKEFIKSQPAEIFISYNHGDTEIANKIQAKLESEGFIVIRDVHDARTGDDIESFIQQSIRRAKFTLSIISPNSLESAWVSLETVYQHYAGILVENRFMPVYTDKVFFDAHFREGLLRRASEKRKAIRQQISDRREQDIGLKDLTSSEEKLDDLIYHLPKILDKLSNTVCADISGANFENGINKLIRDIKEIQRE